MRNPDRSLKTLSVRSFAALIVAATLSMGNESCEKANKGRVLGLEVQIGSMSAKPVKLPNGEVVDFPDVTNRLFYGQVMNNPHFVISSTAPTLGLAARSLTGLSPSGAAASSGYSYRDQQLLKKYGFKGSQSLSNSQPNSQPNSQSNSQSSTQLNTQLNTPLNTQSKSMGRSGLETQVGSTPGRRSDFGSSDRLDSGAGSSDVSECLYKSPMALISGDVISFEANYGGGMSVGYDANGNGLPAGAGGDVQFETSKLQLRMRTDDPLSRKGLILGDGVAHPTNVKFNVKFTAGVPIGLNFFYNTPLADAIKKAMDRALDHIVQRYIARKGEKKTWHDVWESRVEENKRVGDRDEFFAIHGGERANIQVGDRFYLSNMIYTWKGEECNSLLDSKIPKKPGALVEVTEVGDDLSAAKIVEYMIEESILPGARVTIESLQGQREKSEEK